MPTDDQLKNARLVYYKEDIAAIDAALKEFLKLSDAKCVLLIDKDGHLVTKQGFTKSFDPTTIAALVAGSFAATREMAKHLGESEFSVLFHQGKKDHIHLSIVDDRTILAVIFDDRTTIGMVRLYSHETGTKLEAVFEEASKRNPDENEKIQANFGDSAAGALDDILGE